MSVASRALRRALGLPTPRCPRVTRVPDVAVPMPDGTVLRHDHYRPEGVARGPVVLVRSPYGRRSVLGLVLGRIVAERGWQVVMQAVRGTGGSDGELSPFEETDDGVATVRWLLRQPWCDGRLATVGPSYLGLVQWALAPDAVPALAAMGAMVTASQFRDQTYAGEAFSLDNALAWSTMMSDRARGGVVALRRRIGVDRRLPAAMAAAPAGADLVATGGEIGWYRDWLREDDPESAYWAKRSTAPRVGEVGAAGVDVALAGGWQDIFLPWQLQDYAALRAAGARPRLVIGPWVHTTPAGFAAGLRESLAAFDRALGPDGRDPDGRDPDGRDPDGRDPDGLDPDGLAATSAERPVHVELSGGGGHRDLVDWPPPARCAAFHLRADHTVGEEPPEAGADPSVRWAGTTIRYDPRDPTPAVGGPILSGRSGPRPQNGLEARADVAVFTGAVLERDVVALGPARAVIYVRAPVPLLDVFVRVCDVDPSGVSVNVTDGLCRVGPRRSPHVVDHGDGSLAVEVEMWPMGHRFASGHRLRVQVSGGAHPRFARHPGSASALDEDGGLVARPREILHDLTHPSRVELAVE